MLNKVKLVAVLLCLGLPLTLLANDFDWEIGQTVNLTFVNGKIMQVVDKDSMLIGVEDARNGPGKFRQWVMVKHPTKGLVDGNFFGTNWPKIIGTDYMKVTDTTTYKTLSGTRTVYVLEPVILKKDLVKPKGPMKEKDPVKDAVIAKFVGRWTVLDRLGKPSHVVSLSKSLKATKSERGKGLQKGEWDVKDGDVRIKFEDDTKVILRKDKVGLLELSLEPKADWDGKVVLRRRVLQR